MVTPTSASENRMSVDLRVRRTLKRMDEALLALVERHDLADITVVMIAEEAGVSRSTFYDHYQNVHELAEEACTSLIDELVESLPTPDSVTVEQIGPRMLQAFFENLEAHAGLYRNLLGPQGSALVSDHIRRRITATVRTGIESTSGAWPREAANTSRVDDDIAAAFIAGALIGVALAWLVTGLPHTPAAVASTTWELLSAKHGSDGEASP